MIPMRGTDRPVIPSSSLPPGPALARNRMPHSRYIAMAVVRSSWASCRLPVRRYSLPRPRWQWTARGRLRDYRVVVCCRVSGARCCVLRRHHVCTIRPLDSPDQESDVVERCSKCDEVIRPHRPMVVVVLTTPITMKQIGLHPELVAVRWHWSCVPPEVQAHLPAEPVNV
jgi:hypothetical protein